MSDIHVVPKDMKASIKIAEDAASEVPKADSAADLYKASAAVPGATSAGYLNDLGTRWTNETASAGAAAQQLADETQNALNQIKTTDGAVGERAGGIMRGN